MSKPEEASQAFADLQPEQMIDAIEALGYRCDGRFLALNSYENRVYRIGVEDTQPVVAKFYRPNRWSDEAILEEHGFAGELAEAELPVVPPLEVRGRTLHHHGHFRFALYPCEGGRAPDLDDYALLHQIGRLVARIHNIGALAQFEARPAIDIDSYGRDSHRFLLDSGLLPGELRIVYDGVAEQVLAGIRACFDRAQAFRQLRIHADFHPGNVLVAGDRIHIVDLDDTRKGPAVQDLWMFLSGDAAEQAPQLEALLEGYEDFRSFDRRELNLVEALRSLRIMHYAAWLGRRRDDPAFRIAFPWFATQRYWEEHILALREQIALMQEPPLGYC
jgi:Ser/Thr protein kinase RdoA (MazF antagonist)